MLVSGLNDPRACQDYMTNRREDFCIGYPRYRPFSETDARQIVADFYKDLERSVRDEKACNKDLG